MKSRFADTDASAATSSIFLIAISDRIVVLINKY